jgi:polar amino acid transport system substrate-binding protein
VAALSLAACGGATGTTNTLGTKTAGQITFAFRSDDKPQSFVQGDKPTGFMIELTEAMAAKMGLTPHYVSTDFNSMLPDVHNHTYDSAAFEVLVTPARQQVDDFTTPVTYSQAQLVSRKNAPVSSVQAAGGKSIAVTRGSELIPILQRQAPGVTVKEFPNIAASANALTAGQVDGLFTGVATTAQLLAQHPTFTATQEINTGAAALPVARDRSPLKQALDTALAAVIADGTYTTLFDKWNPAGLLIPSDMLKAYPGMRQRGAHP